MTAKTDDPGFLKRWSARKLAPDDAPDTTAPDAGASDAADDVLHDGVPAAPEDGQEGAQANAETPPPDLPDVETLDGESDYSVFLGENVPEDLTRLALRKLWRSDPALANLDGLNDYDTDFTMAGKAAEAVKTAYRVGRGYADDAQLPGETGDDATVHDDVARAEPDVPDGDAADEADVGPDDTPDDTPDTADGDDAADGEDNPRHT